NLSRQKPAACIKLYKNADKSKIEEIPDLEDFLTKRDYVGAITFLEFQKRIGKVFPDFELWIAYCLFHLGDYKKAYSMYNDILEHANCDANIVAYKACCCMYLGLYDEAHTLLNQAPESKLKSRLLFHLSHKFDEDHTMMMHMSNFKTVEDNCCYYSLNYMREKYDEAVSSYKHVLHLNKEFIALKVYIAMCYFKMEYYDVAQELLSDYMHFYPDSIAGTNLRACIYFRLYNGKTAETELESIQVTTPTCSDIINHNLVVVFRDGRGAQQALPPLIDVVYEARINYSLYLVKNGEYADAYNLLKEFNPTHTKESVIKAVTLALLGQEEGNVVCVNCVISLFSATGTIVSRQCMSCACFLNKQFKKAIDCFNSVKGFLYNDDDFNFNYGQAKTACGAYKDAEQVFDLVQNEKLRNEYSFLSCLCHCYIMNKKPQLAWELYLKLETSADSFRLLQLIANDCYKMKEFLIAAKAFDVLEHADPNPDYWDGKRGAVVGLFQSIVLGMEPRKTLKELLVVLRNTSNPQVEYIARVITKWAKDNRVQI
uniref:Intraflagellar transport protein 56 n=1 Tax=Ciona savignyi TaxID=51511 RepID=H2Z4T5_CIOSA